MQKVNPRGLLSLLLFLVLLFMLGYYAYLTLQTRRLSNMVMDRQQLLQQEQNTLREQQQDSSYLRFQAAQLVTSQFYGVDWKQRYEYLIQVLNMVKQLDEKIGITLTDINVMDTKISLRGEAGLIQTIYTPGGLIDQFTELEFVEHMMIPFYRKSGEVFEFILDATIKPYDAIGGEI